NSNSGASFSTTRQEGSHAVALTTSGYLSHTVSGNNSTFLTSGGYDQRTVALWIRPGGTNNRRMVFEFGDNNNGLGLRFNDNALIAGIAGGGTRVTASYANVASASGTPWISGGWNHVAVVYDKTSLRLYLNGVNVASNNSLTFASVGSSTNASRFAYPSATAAANHVFNQAGTWTYLGGSMDDIYVIRGALRDSEIAALRNLSFNTQSTAVTLAAPAAPTAPTGLAATALSTNAIKLTWNDNSENETGFEIWRSSGDKSNERMIAVVEGGSGAQKTFTDTSLFANVTYYFKVKARGEVLNSAFTPEVDAKTLNGKPHIKDVLDFSMLYGTSYSLPLSAIDEDGDALTFTTSGLPAFGTLQNISNGNGAIVFNPSSRNRGSFRITVYVSDPNGGKDTTSFVLAVNTNDVPVMPAIADVVIDEGTSINVPVSATDKNGVSKMIWRVEGLPSFANFVNNNNGTGTIAINANYASSGEYEITAFVDDGYGAWTSQSFKLTVNDIRPDAAIQINFRHITGGVPLWNDVDISSLSRDTAYTITDVDGNPFPFRFRITKGGVASTQGGRITGNDSGVYPDNVLRDAMAWAFNSTSSDTAILRVSGLDPAKRYDFTLFSGYTTGAATTYIQYVIGNDTASLYYHNNTQNTAMIQNAQPNADGQVFITLIGDPVVGLGGVLNAMIIRPLFSDGTAPAKPLQFQGEFTLGEGVKLGWEDRAYNEDGYRVYRSTNKYGTYTLLNPQVERDSVSFLDPNTLPETTYYYYVAGINAIGTGASSDTIAITTGNNLPVITAAERFLVKTGATANLDFTAADDPGDIVTVTLLNKPGFVELQHLGGINYRITASPLNDHLGWFTLTLRAADNKGAVSTKDVILSVADKNTRSVYVNFGREDKPAPFPWNNWLGARGSNNTLSNLKDEQNNTTPFSITTVESWTGVTTMGHMTGNNSGIFPDAVLESGLHNIGGPRTIRISGLNNNMRYNIVFVGSMNEGALATARYRQVSGTADDTLNARYNTNQSANLNGLAPVGGQISAEISRILGSLNAYLNAVVIEEYDPNLLTAPLNPINLYAEPVDRTTIDLSWSDRTANEAAVNGYMLDRATDSLFTVNVVNMGLPANTTTYRDAGLSANQKYWYRVRARSAAGAYSDYSNRAKAITPASIVYVNFNFTIDNGPFPWNNIYASPTSPDVFTGFKNQSGAGTGLTLSLTKIFNGEFTAGVNTGNNSGIVPDNVMMSDFWLDNTQESQFVLSGLNHSRRYRIGFFGSAGDVGWSAGDFTATYTVNGKTVYLNSWLNRSKIVYIDDIVPDVNGEVRLDFSTTEDALFGFNGAVIIQDYTDVSEGGEVINNMVNNPNSANILMENDDAADLAMAAAQEGSSSARMYPNPVVSFLNVDFNNASASDNVSLMVYDISGKLLYMRNYGKLSAGPHTLGLSAKESGMTTGIYFVSLNVNGKAIKTTKVVKTKE
ncbi:MAG TPA: T9SS type A sorting domain-containing protein, partial [Flavitalea sp.]|nr:T9SS type A sorting domain-containing protein [Flavitalea sp.]